MKIGLIIVGLVLCLINIPAYLVDNAKIPYLNSDLPVLYGVTSYIAQMFGFNMFIVLGLILILIGFKTKTNKKATK